MLGKRSSHDEREHPYLDHLGRDSFYGFLASHRGELFHDEDFTGLYCSDNGRPSVPPSLLATALLFQAHDGVSDVEAKARADFALRWKAALGIGLEERPFAKSTLQLFRARPIIHERVRTIFERSLAFARRTGYFRIDLETMSCTCPAGQQTRKVVSRSSGERYGAPGVPLRAFRFDDAICGVYPLRSMCVRARQGKGRQVMIH